MKKFLIYVLIVLITCTNIGSSLLPRLKNPNPDDTQIEQTEDQVSDDTINPDDDYEITDEVITTEDESNDENLEEQTSPSETQTEENNSTSTDTPNDENNTVDEEDAKTDDNSGEDSNENIADPSTEEPSNPQTEEPNNPQTEEPGNPQTEEPGNPQTEEPGNPQTEEPSNPQTEEPSNPQTEEPSNPQTEEPGNPQTEEPSNPQTEEKEPEVPKTPAPKMFAENSKTDKEFNVFLMKINALYDLAVEYRKTNSTSSSAIKLTLSYIRSSKYNDSYWKMIIGAADANFITYVSNHKNPSLDVTTLRQSNVVTVPTTGKRIDVPHLFAVANTVYVDKSSTKKIDLTGWGGDICQLVQSLKTKYPNASAEELKIYAQKMFNASSNSSFGDDDVNADIDGYNLAILLLNCNPNKENFFLSDIFYDYYNTSLKAQKQAYLDGLFASGKTVSSLYSRLNSNLYISVLCSKYNISLSSDKKYFEASIEAFLNYLKSN